MSKPSPLTDPDVERQYLAHAFLSPAVLDREPADPAWFSVHRFRALLDAMRHVHEAGELRTDLLRAELIRRGSHRLLEDALAVTDSIPTLTAQAARDRLRALHLERVLEARLSDAIAAVREGRGEDARSVLDEVRSLDVSTSAPAIECVAEWGDDPIGSSPPPLRWLLRQRDRSGRDDRSAGVLALGTVGTLLGAGGVGKSKAMMQLALAVASGRTWLDTFDVIEPGSVFLALGEHDRADVQRDLHYASRAMGLSPAERDRAARALHVIPLAKRDVALTSIGPDQRIHETSWMRELRAHLRRREWRLVVLDPLARFAAGGVETDNEHATSFVRILESLTDLPGSPAILVPHHTSKTARANGTVDATAARGSTGLTDAFRWVALMRPLVVGRGEKRRVDRMCVALDVVKTTKGPPTRSLYLLREEGGALRPMDATELAERDVPHDDGGGW